VPRSAIVAALKRSVKCKYVPFARVMKSVRALEDAGLVLEVTSGAYMLVEASSDRVEE